MAEFKYVELPPKAETGPTRPALVTDALEKLGEEGWEPISLADAPTAGKVSVLLRRD
jgi:hypothetical protein